MHRNGNRESAALNKCDKRRENKTINSIMVEMDAGNLNNKRCNICYKDFSRRANYIRHMNQFHKHGKREPKPSGRKRHINSALVEMDAGDHRNKRCTICKRIYTVELVNSIPQRRQRKASLQLNGRKKCY